MEYLAAMREVEESESKAERLESVKSVIEN
jgi:hypothetical protein